MGIMPCKDTCIIHIKDLFSFEWDTMFVFPPHFGDTICRKYQMTQKHSYRRIAFVKDSKIMYCEDEVAIEGPYSSHIMSDDIFYTPETAVFYVIWDKEHGSYDLIPFWDNREEMIKEP
jgi:hypothetical protein